jgi:hypothetical protein
MKRFILLLFFAVSNQKGTEDIDTAGMASVDDVESFFSPELGNVLFASAYDGWAFRFVDLALLRLLIPSG